MAVDSKHPEYAEFSSDWEMMRDTYEGERVVKEAGQRYLPATAGQVQDGLNKSTEAGRIAYESYKLRARFPDVVRVAVDALVGVMHSKPPTIELPPSMEDMIDSATLQGESLEVLLRRINEQQLITGRIGLLLDVLDQAPVGTNPYIATYPAMRIMNWDDGTRHELVKQTLNLVALDESENERINDFEWEFQNKYRVCILGDAHDNNASGVYSSGEFRDDTQFTQEAMVVPTIGGRALDEIPFTFINATDVVPSPLQPPLSGLAQLALGIYRGEADYRQALFMQGQDTLVITGVADEDKSYRTGANSVLTLSTGADAKFIGVSSQGIPEMRQALENDKMEAVARGGQLLDSNSRQRESGDALRIRVVARTATLNLIAKTGAFGLEQCLKQAARWTGANEDQVVVEPNLDFVDDEIGGEELVKLMTAKELGAPISEETIHILMQAKGLTDKAIEDELELIAKEDEVKMEKMKAMQEVMNPDLGEEDEDEPPFNKTGDDEEDDS